MGLLWNGHGVTQILTLMFEDMVENLKIHLFSWYFIQIDQISEISNQMFWPWMLSQIWKYEKEKAYLIIVAEKYKCWVIIKTCFIMFHNDNKVFWSLSPRINLHLSLWIRNTWKLEKQSKVKVMKAMCFERMICCCLGK